jgi:putative Holliday junction resolvase
VTVLLGIDLGDRRIGVAIADTETGSVKPLLTIRRGTHAQDAATLGQISQERHAEELVVGLPLHRDGRESEQSERTRAWVAQVSPRLGLPVAFRDERLTSEAAEARMGHAPRGRSGGAPSAQARNAWRARIDREAAADILQRELDARNTSEVTT